MSSSGSDGGLSLPSWLTSLKPYTGALSDVGESIQQWGNFRLAVIGIVATWIVNGFLDLWGYVVGAVFLAFDPVIGAFGLAEGGLETALGGIASPIYSALGSLTITVGEIVGASGPAAPLVGSLIFAIVLVGAYYVGKFVLGAIPVVDTINQFI